MIEFLAGYDEWNVILDGEVVYSFDDLSDQMPDSLESDADLEDTVEDLIENMCYELDTGEKDIEPYIKEELYENLEELKKTMMENLFCHYGEAA